MTDLEALFRGAMRAAFAQGFAYGLVAGVLLAMMFMPANAEPAQSDVARGECYQIDDVVQSLQSPPRFYNVWELEKAQIEGMGLEGTYGVVAERPDLEFARVITFVHGCAHLEYDYPRGELEAVLREISL